MKQRAKRSTWLISSVLAVLLLLSGCGQDLKEENRQDTITPKDDSLIVVGVSQIGSESVWRTANTASIQSTFSKENGYFLIFDNARQKQENQIKALRSFISQQVDYIVFSPIVEDGWDTVLKEAKDAGIPVILMDRKVNVKDESLYTAWVGSDFTEEGKRAGRWLSGHLEEEGRGDETVNIVVLQGTNGSSSVIGRTKGFDSVAAQHDKWNILEQVDADFTTAKGKEEMNKMLQKYEDIDVVVSQNDDMTFGALEAIQEAGKTTGTQGGIIVISFDATKSALEKVEEGIINVDIECNPEQGTYIEKVIKTLESGERAEKEYFVSERVFTKKNVDSVIDDRSY
ncbi:ABC transporter substrate-binding protein [Extibacter muris]|uniref:ABC transporter substrate-binding protein n=1 Tax=Extibacter muris TaxID=1796622 RepID=UPI001D061E26|nr:ABC transporter substrate-binding protein [Extibacter muris]MCB6202185.1 ABC transporter substrate-binding protein [Extibacter muris]MCQ4662620.1 ABC transporter substrate-binding protein [Extibacter muris]MCQ4693097.1 ABC transporter substrate-binding protein [Extibacter muris]